MSGEDRRTGKRAATRAVAGAAVAAGLLSGFGSAVSPQAAERSERPRLCPEDAPEGVRLPPRPGCEARAEPATKDANGFRDLGNGTSLRVGGRVGAAFDARR